MKTGTVRNVYYRQDEPGVLIILECSDVEEAKRVTDELPFVKKGLLELHFIPLVHFPGLEMLFASDVLQTLKSQP